MMIYIDIETSIMYVRTYVYIILICFKDSDEIILNVIMLYNIIVILLLKTITQL